SLEGSEKEIFDKELEEKTLAFNKKMAKEFELTIIHRIEIDDGEINHQAQGEVPGVPLNQFSMDEYNGFLRIATTTGQSWSIASLNHLYILDEDLKIAGSVEDLAQGERIYATRFLGDKAYMVTFRQVDPLYAIDVTDPENPFVVGYLKITGYSSYLHPYDKDHIIGVGMEASQEGRVQGLKIALFDITDMENPKQLSSFDFTQLNPNIQSYSYSEALNDHKAFLFSKEKELLIIPINYNAYDTKNYNQIENWQGAYVFKINLQDGIKPQGKISHNEDNQDWQHMIRRSLYIDDTLYTISLQKIRANALDTLQQMNEIKII
ncbi:MAG: beta-propeller domain-containing protein, partial [Nanoarchaeota archaeon]